MLLITQQTNRTETKASKEAALRRVTNVDLFVFVLTGRVLTAYAFISGIKGPSCSLPDRTLLYLAGHRAVRKRRAKHPKVSQALPPLSITTQAVPRSEVLDGCAHQGLKTATAALLRGATFTCQQQRLNSFLPEGLAGAPARSLRFPTTQLQEPLLLLN